MNWGGFLNPMAGLWFLLVGPLVILYFLKLRRPQLEVPSLVLWRSVINDSRVNSPFQKFKRNLLLLLQLALLGCLVLAAMRPFWRGTADQAQYLPVLIDCSASMAALDKPGGQSRLDLAKQEVGRLIDNLLPGQRLALIAVANSARSLCDFSDNPRILRAALDKLTVQHAPSRLEDGLRMAQALALTNPVDPVVVDTDGTLPTVVRFDLPCDLSYQNL
ncbi:MAG: vWA domain-containing protein, partial [Planctomycetaceae bacterium]